MDVPTEPRASPLQRRDERLQPHVTDDDKVDVG
jgi:hypothetical protein